MEQMKYAIPGYLTENQFAQTVNLTVWGIRAWRRRNYGPPVTKFGKLVYYRQDHVDAFLAAPGDFCGSL